MGLLGYLLGGNVTFCYYKAIIIIFCIRKEFDFYWGGWEDLEM